MPMPPEATAECDGAGLYSLRSFRSVVDPFRDDVFHSGQLRMTEISKMKGQDLVCAQNAKLIAVNLRFITYATKEGWVRVINQNGKDMFKVANSTKGKIMDLALLGTGAAGKDHKTTLLCVDDQAHVSIFPITDSETQGKCEDVSMQHAELIFPMQPNETPQRVLAHPTDGQVFVTMHEAHVSVWNLSKLLAGTPSKVPQPADEDRQGFVSFESRGTAALMASSRATSSGYTPLRDAALSADGKCLITLLAQELLVVEVFRLPVASIGGGGNLELMQTATLGGAPAHSLRVMGEGQGYIGTEPAQVLIAAGASGCDLRAFRLATRAASPVGPLVQEVRIEVPPEGRSLQPGDPTCCVDVTPSPRDILGVAFTKAPFVLILPLAKAWTPERGLPLPSVRKLVTDCPTHQTSYMTGKSFGTRGETFFMFRGYNFLRPKDALPGCRVVVDETVNPEILSRMEPYPTVMPSVPSAEPEPQAEPSPYEFVSRTDTAAGASPPTTTPPAASPAADPLVVPADAKVAPPAHRLLPPPPSSPAPAPPALAAEDDADAAVASESAGEEATEQVLDAAGGGDYPTPAGDVEAAGGGDPGSSVDEATQAQRRGGGENMDWGFVKQIAASFVKGLEHRRGKLADQIVAEVTELIRDAHPGGGSTAAISADLAVLEQALAKVKEARKAQTASERNVQSVVRRASDAWAEASQAAVTEMLHKELDKVSDGVAGSLAQQLATSRKFCEALARAVQKSGGVAAGQAVEAMRPAKQLQETVGTALADALNECLAPVFKEELRSHFEDDLVPLIGQRVGEMMSSFRDRMGACMSSIAAEHEEAAKRLGRELAPVVRSELQEVERVVAAARQSAGGGSASSALSDAQLEELARAVQAEVVQPLQMRIRDLSSQVQAMRRETQELEQRWRDATAASASGFGASGSHAGASPTDVSDAHQAAELERTFRSGRVEDAFARAVALQPDARQEDFVGRLCGLVREPLDFWLSGGGASPPLSMPLKGSLMLTLARQLELGALQSEARSSKLEWLQELYFAYEVDDPSVVKSAPATCAQLAEALDRVPPVPGEEGDQLRQLRKMVRQAARLLQQPTTK